MEWTRVLAQRPGRCPGDGRRAAAAAGAVLSADCASRFPAQAAETVLYYAPCTSRTDVSARRIHDQIIAVSPGSGAGGRARRAARRLGRRRGARCLLPAGHRHHHEALRLRATRHHLRLQRARPQRGRERLGHPHPQRPPRRQPRGERQEQPALPHRPHQPLRHLHAHAEQGGRHRREAGRRLQRRESRVRADLHQLGALPPAPGGGHRLRLGGHLPHRPDLVELPRPRELPRHRRLQRPGLHRPHPPAADPLRLQHRPGLVARHRRRERPRHRRQRLRRHRLGEGPDHPRLHRQPRPAAAPGARSRCAASP